MFPQVPARFAAVGSVSMWIHPYQVLVRLLFSFQGKSAVDNLSRHTGAAVVQRVKYNGFQAIPHRIEI